MIKPLSTSGLLSGASIVLLQALLLTPTSLVCLGQARGKNAVISTEIVRASSEYARSSSRDQDGDRDRGRALKVNVNLVLVPVTVTDQDDRGVLGLGKDSFIIYEGKHQQAISHLSTEDAPISMGIIFDSSASMSQKLALTRKGIVRFLLHSNPQDEFFLVALNTRPQLLADFTSSVEEIQDDISKASPEGETALLDAVYFSLSHMRKAKNERKVLLIVSDGQDNHSRYTTSEVVSLVREAGVQVYAMGIVDRILLEGTAITKANRMGMQLLASITDITGGRTFRIRNLTMMEDAAAKVAAELRNQYLIAYRPNNPVRDGKWRKIKVRVVPQRPSHRLSVYAKTGYYAPAE